MSDLFDAEAPSSKADRRARRAASEVPASDASAAVSPAAEAPAEDVDTHAENNAAQVALMQNLKTPVGAPAMPERVLDDAARLRLSKIVDAHLSPYKRDKIHIHEVRALLLTLVANI